MSKAVCLVNVTIAPKRKESVSVRAGTHDLSSLTFVLCVQAVEFIVCVEWTAPVTVLNGLLLLLGSTFVSSVQRNSLWRSERTLWQVSHFFVGSCWN